MDNLFHLKMPRSRRKPYTTLTIEQKQQKNEGIDALKKSLIFLEQQDNVDFKTEDLTAVRRLINQITLHHLSLLRQTSIELFLQ